ncbi:hypothetical protein SDC9_67944 [bioreactor metagenome]|uniref:Uncharacterized protein n=1 Tax=bioreactor metagenome TaxID=1076179 RepID=A0A644XZ38_9ZZZZ
MELDVARIVRQGMRRHRLRALHHAAPPTAGRTTGGIEPEKRRRCRHQLAHIAFQRHTAFHDGRADVADLAHGQGHNGQPVLEAQAHIRVLCAHTLTVWKLHLNRHG